MAKILITGGSGFIGSHLADELIKIGDQVWVVDNFITGNKKNIEQLLDNPNFTFIEASVTQPVENYLDPELKFEQIYHMASPASPRGYQDNPIATYEVNSFGTHYLAAHATNIGARLLYASTSEVYGEPLEHPQKETYWGNVNIRGIRSCYDVSKRFGEMVQTVWAREKNLDIRTVRIFNTYGPRMDPLDGRIIPNFVTQALKNEAITVYGDGSQTRSFCFVSDLVRGLIQVMNSEKARGEVYNLGNPDERTVLDVAKLIVEVMGSKSEITFLDRPLDDPSRRKPDITKITTEIGWQPEVEFSVGLQQTIEYFENNLE
jgi:nucleoside-diphosphate-sugar epimerase